MPNASVGLTTNISVNNSYVGRFAPSPTGPLHMGSLVAAAASYLRARQQNGQWLVRIEDIDPPREVPGASALILNTLEHFGFEWDAPVVYQSQRTTLYLEAKQALKTRGLIYPCVCSRRSIREYIEQHGLNDSTYPRLCLTTVPSAGAKINWRLHTQGQSVTFGDLYFGQQQIDFDHELGDFVVWRKDNLPGYPLAVTVDDHHQEISEVVRGSDLLRESAGQILLRTYLGWPQPKSLHVPVVRNERQDKLSKGSGAAPINAADAVQQLCTAFSLLGLDCSTAPQSSNLDELWSWAIQHWDFKSMIKMPIL